LDFVDDIVVVVDYLAVLDLLLELVQERECFLDKLTLTIAWEKITNVLFEL
jgi:hypothetical protein